MANLTDTSVNGDLRVTGTMFGTQAGNYATCATAAGTAAKAVTISGFTLTTGIHVYVKFTVTNTAAVASLTLNVSGTGAKAMKYRGGDLPAVGTLSASRVYEFIYDGTNWELVGDLDTNTQTVTGVKGNAESSYRTGQVNITPANIGVSATTTSVTVGSTTASIPQATTTTPKMDGTAAVGSETTWAKGDHVHPTDTSRAPTSHASSATTYGVGTTANYGHVKLDNSTPLTVGTTSADGVATGKAHIHNAIESVPRISVTTADLAHINTNSCAHMIFSQISASTSTTHDPGDGYMLSFMWDNTCKYDAQLFIPDDRTSATDFGRLKIRYCNNSAWGDWGYLPLATQCALLTSADDLNNIKAYHAGEIIGCNWSTGNVPANAPLSSATSQMLVFRTHSGNYLNQLVIVAGGQMYVRNCNNNTWGAWEKMLVSSDITTGSANGTISVAGTDVAVKGLGGAAYLNTGTASGTVATGNHTHTTSIASDSSSGTVVALAHDTQYKLTAGGTSVLFKTPADSNTDTKVTQTLTTTADAAYPILTKNTTETANVTDTSRFTTGVTLNPKNKSITATTFIGALSGNATTATSLYKTAISYHRPVASNGDGKQWCRLATLTEANIASGGLWYGVGVVVNLYVNPYEVVNRQMHFGTYELVFRIGISAGSGYSLKTSGEMGIRRLHGPDRKASADGRSGIDWKIVRSDTKVEFFIKNSEWDSSLYIEKTQEVNGAGSRWVWKVENGLYTDDEFATYCSDKTTVDDTIRLTYKSNALVFPRKSSFNYDNWTQASSLITAEADYNGATNAPSTNWFYLLSMQGEDTAYAGQIAFRMTGDPGLFIRQRKSSAWNSWYRLLTTGDVTSTYSATGTSPVNGTAVASAISGKSPTSHTHTVKINGAEKTIAATGGTAVNLGTYTEFAHVSDTAVIGNNSPAADCKTYFANNVSNGSCKVVYCKNGEEYTIIFSKQSAGTYGNIIKYGYASKYIYILRYKNSVWQSDDWEKIAAGYADSAASATNSNNTKVTTATTTKAYLTAATATNYSSGGQTSLLADTGVYLTTTAGELVATKFTGNLTGNVTGDCSGSSGSCTGNAATATSAGKLTTARKAYVTLGTASTTTTVDWSADPTTIPVDGTLAVSHGGTGMTTVTNVNSVVIGNSSSATGAMQTVAAANGAFYSTGANVKPQFGTLPAAQGGTGKTSAKDACNAFINALDTGSSTPVDADYYVSQYVSGGTTTTTYHRRPMSALWTYIKGKLTSVSGVNISGNAATATSATNVALTGSVKTTSTTDGDTIQFQAGSGTAGTVTIVNAKHAASADSATSASSASKVANKLTLKIKTGTTEGTDLYTYDGSGAKTLDIKQGSNITLTAAAGSLTIAGTADTKNTAGSTDTSSKIFLIGATTQAANPQTYSQDTTYVDTDATLASAKVRVAEKCTLQFNNTTNALDFVFA